MSEAVKNEAEDLQQALVGALAGLLDCDDDEVDLRLRAPGAQTFSGQVRFDLDVTGPSPSPGTPVEAAPVPGAPVLESDQRAPGGDQTAPDGDAPTRAGESQDDEVAISPEDLDAEADAAADFMEGLLDAMDLPGDLRIRIHEDHAELEVVDIGSGALIGRRGQTLEAIQELVRCSLQREFQRRARVKIDAEGYRARRMEKLVEKAEEAIESVLAEGGEERLEPMDVFERKEIHRLVAEHAGLQSRSQGREPARRIVIEQA